MKKFSFNLERLLRLREYEEHQWEIKLGTAVTECVKIENEISYRTSEISRVLVTRGNFSRHENEQLSIELYKRRMKDEIIKLTVKLKKAEADREEIRKGFLDASKNRKVLSKLKEKREKEYYRDQIKQEFDTVNEINNSRAAGRLKA